MTNETSEVMELLRLFEQSDFTALHVETAGLSLSVAKEGGDLAGLMVGAAPVAAPEPPRPLQAPSQLPSVEANTTQAQAPSKPGPVGGDETVMRSPMLGTFYRSPAPEEPPFVNVGETVTKGQVLCIIECMKLFNTIEAEADGVVTGIDVANGAMVEFGQSLVRIRAS